MDKWTAIMCIGLGFAVAAMMYASKDNPYESYNRAIWDCRSAKDYQSCIVAVNSAYTRMLSGTNGQDTNKNTNNK